MIFIHYSAEGTKCAFVEITEVPFHLSVILSSQCDLKRQMLYSHSYFVDFAAQKKRSKVEGEFVEAIAPTNWALLTPTICSAEINRYINLRYIMLQHILL